jgi:urease accessory protein
MKAMFDAASRCEAHEACLPAYIRAKGRISARFSATPRGTRAVDFAESGGYRLKFPHADGCEATLVNTGGGVTGGDHLAIDIALDDGAAVTVTTQSAEKIYRAQHDPARMSVQLSLGEQALLDWLPQETILFSGARLDRRLEVAMAGSARLTLCEMLVFGRAAMGEAMTAGRLSDRWLIRRDGALILAEALRLDGLIAATLARPAVGKGARAVSTFVHIAPDAEAHRSDIQEFFAECSCEAGVSAWDGILVVRLCADDAARLRRELFAFLIHFRRSALPRVWS